MQPMGGVIDIIVYLTVVGAATTTTATAAAAVVSAMSGAAAAAGSLGIFAPNVAANGRDVGKLLQVVTNHCRSLRLVNDPGLEIVCENAIGDRRIDSRHECSLRSNTVCFPKAPDRAPAKLQLVSIVHGVPLVLKRRQQFAVAARRTQLGGSRQGPE